MNLSEMIFQGTVHGRTIEIDRDLGLPDGQAITIVVKSVPARPADYETLVRRLSGAWASDGPELDQFLRECRQDDSGERPELEP